MKTLLTFALTLAMGGLAMAIPPDASNHPRVARDFTAAVPGASYLIGTPPPSRDPIDYNDWSVKANLPTALTGTVYVPITLGRKYLYAFGGSTLNSIFIYDIASNTWATSSVTMPTGVDYASGIYCGGKVYIFGGAIGINNQNLVQIFNPQDSTWTSGTPMSVACSDPVVFNYQDSLIYVCGGLTTFWTGYTNAVQIYNRVRNTWASGTALPVSRGTAGGGVVGNTAVFALGIGWNGSGYDVLPETYEGAINPSNPTQITWTLGTDYPAGGKYRVTSGTLGNQVFVGNGGDMSANGYAQTYAYDPSTHAWTPFADKPTAMMNSRNYAVMDSTLYVAGGYVSAALDVHEALNLRQLPHDVATFAIRSPLAKEGPRTTIAPKVVYKNQGQNPETNIRVGCFVDSAGTILYRDSALVASMAVGDTALVTFQNWTLGPLGATYTFTGWCRMAGDNEPMDDTLRQRVSIATFRKVREIIGPPVPSGNARQGLAWDGGNTMYWAEGDAATTACIVYKMDKTTGNLITQFNVATGGYVAGAVYAHGELWIVQWSSANTIVKCDTLGNITGTFSTPGSYTRGLGYSAATDHLYITDTEGTEFGGTFYETDTTGAVLRTVSTGSDVDWGMAGLTRVRTDSNVVWVSDDGGNQDLREVNVDGSSSYLVAAHDVRADFPLGVYTGGSFFDGQYLYVGQVLGNMIYVYDIGAGTGVEAGGTNPPKAATYALGQAYPNPARGGVNISLSLPQDGKASLTVYNVLGQPVAALLNGAVKAGTKTVSWNGRTAKGQLAPSGVYFYRLQAGNFTATRKLVVAR